jgi:hypothetical protein
MDCELLDKMVMDLLYNEATQQQSIDAKRHVEQCTRCASLLNELRSTRKAVFFPLVEAPTGFEEQLLEEVRRAQREIPLPRRLGRWISWAGAYAMRPQVAMGVLLFVMIGFGLFLFRVRHNNGAVDVVRVTERGVPERDRTETPIAQNPALLMPPATEEKLRTKDGHQRDAASSETNNNGFDGTHSSTRVNRDGKPASSVAAASSTSPVGSNSASSVANESGARGEGSLDSRIADQSEPSSPSSNASSNAFSDAMALFKAGNYASAYRAFDSIAYAGGANAPSAALYAAKSVRASSGCVHALPRFESVAVRFAGTSAGQEARWETAACARITGDLVRARIIYRDLARIPSQRERAEAELARISSASPTPAATASGSPAQSPPSVTNDKPDSASE